MCIAMANQLILNENGIKCDANYGHFGYHTVSEGLIVPFVFRSGERLFPLTMFRCLLSSTFAQNENLQQFSYLSSQMENVTKIELQLIKEINFIHNDGIYPKSPENEKLLKRDDVEQITQYLIDVNKAKNDQRHIKCGGFVKFMLKSRIGKENILPFYKKNDKELVPLEPLKKLIKNEIHWTVYELKNIEIMYIKLLASSYKSEMSFDSDSTIMDCIDVVELNKNCSQFSRYWPNSNDLFETDVLPSPPPPPKMEPIISKTETAITLPKQQTIVPQTKFKKPEKENNNNNNTKNNKRKHDENQSSDSDIEEGHFEVEKILKYRSKNGGEFLVRWKGYTSSDDTWEPIENLSENLQDEAREMMQRKRKKV